MAVDTTILGLSPEEAEAKPYIASMGIYVFKKSALVKFLESDYPRITISAVRSFPMRPRTVPRCKRTYSTITGRISER